MNKPFVAASSAMILAFGLQGCASTVAPTPETASPQITSPAAESLPISKDMVTVDNLLRWPLEGPDGADKVSAGLGQVFELRELKSSWFTGEKPVKLADNYVLSFTWIGPGPNRIDIGLKQEPCFSPERAVEITGAIMDPVFRTDHGVDFGRTYYAERNGVLIRIKTTPETYRCVVSIHVSPIRKLSE